MVKPIVASSGPITLVGGGNASIADLSDALTIAPICVAADGGAELALKAGVTIEALIGDFDSVSAVALSQIPPDRHFRISEQETTDFDKAIRSIDAPLTIAVGFTGGRIDHQLSAYSTLARHPDRRCILLTPNEIILLAPPEIAVPTQPGDVVSIFPLGLTRGTSRGLEWPIDGVRLDPFSRIGTSNRALGPVTLSVDAPAALLILPRRIIRQVVQALMLSTGAGWPPLAGR